MRRCLALAGSALVACAAHAEESCRATMADLQDFRDKIEMVRTQTHGARNDFGPGREKAGEAVAITAAALEQALGRAMPPSPETLYVHTAGGWRVHPRMTLARQALAEAHRAFDRAHCLLAEKVEPVRTGLAGIDAALAEADAYNPFTGAGNAPR